MANAYTDTTALAGAIASALDRELRYELRALPIWRQFVDVHATGLTNPGAPAVLKVNDVIAVQVTALDEILDPDSVVIPAPRTVSITPVEQGAHSIETLKVRDLAYLDVVRLQLRDMMVNQQDSIDLLVMRKHDAGTNVASLESGVYKTTVTEANIASTDLFTSALVGKTTATLRARNVRGKRGELYAGVVHPFISLDIQSEGPSAASWLYAHANGGDLTGIYNAETGIYRGAAIVESNKVRVTATGTSSGNVFSSYFLGSEFLAEYLVTEPHLTMGPVGADPFSRKMDVGWYGYLGWATYRDAALQRVKTSSSLAAAASTFS